MKTSQEVMNEIEELNKIKGGIEATNRAIKINELEILKQERLRCYKIIAIYLPAESSAFKYFKKEMKILEGGEK